MLNEHASNKVILVDFYAEFVPHCPRVLDLTLYIPGFSWCGPCRMISPILEKLTGDGNTKTGSGRSLDLVTIDTDKEIELAQKYQVSFPASLFVFHSSASSAGAVTANGHGLQGRKTGQPLHRCAQRGRYQEILATLVEGPYCLPSFRYWYRKEEKSN